LPKAWISTKDQGIWLYKGGTSGFDGAGNEPRSESYASQIAQKLGMNATIYGLASWKGRLASTCRLFTDIDTSFAPMGRIGLPTVFKFCKTLGSEFVDQLSDMLVFDALIFNTDRHFGNFGLLRDNHTGRFIRPAPIFDNGRSRFAYAAKSDFIGFEWVFHDPVSRLWRVCIR
jgi:hypothetical protein